MGCTSQMLRAASLAAVLSSVGILNAQPASAGVFDIPTLRYDAVVSLREVLSVRFPDRVFSSATFRFERLVASDDHWAVTGATREGSFIVGGHHKDATLAAMLPKHYDQVAIDPKGNIHLQLAGRGDVDVVDYSGQTIRSYGLAENSLSIFRAGDLLTAVPKPREGTKDAEETTKTIGPVDPNARLIDSCRVHGLPSGGYLAFNTITETISIYDSQGNFLGSSVPDLDSAFLRIGRPVPKPKNTDPREGASRAMWSAVSPDGLLWIGLAGYRAIEDHPIALFEPHTGKFLRAIYAEVPKAPNGPDGKIDYDRAILTTAGAIGKRLLLFGGGSIFIYNVGRE